MSSIPIKELVDLNENDEEQDMAISNTFIKDMEKCVKDSVPKVPRTIKDVVKWVEGRNLLTKMCSPSSEYGKGIQIGKGEIINDLLDYMKGEE